jgi:hypothetical protein
MNVMACVYRAAAVIATDKEDLVERVKQITGTHCSVRRGKNPTASSTMCYFQHLVHVESPRFHLLATEYKLSDYTGLLFAPNIAHGVMVGLLQNARRISLHLASAAFKCCASWWCGKHQACILATMQCRWAGACGTSASLVRTHECDI